jgi:hypothetical protein
VVTAYAYSMTGWIPISSEARGKLRLVMARIEDDARKVEAATDRIPLPLLRDIALKGRVGAARSLARVLAVMPLRPFYSERGSVGFRYLAPAPEVPPAVGAVAADADQQASVVATIIMLNAGGGRPRLSREPFGAAFTTHALCRLLERSGFSVDPVQAMFEAHDALLALDPVAGALIFDRERLLVPTQSGGFIMSPRRVGAWASPVAVARTWLDAGQLRDDQDTDLVRWRQLLDLTKRG